MDARQRPADAGEDLEPFEFEVEEFEYEYRDGEGNILAEFNDIEARGTAMRTLIEDGHGTLRSYVRGRKTLGSYGDRG